MKLLIIAFNYPSKYYPARGVFVQKLANELMNQGVEVGVIAPLAIGPQFIKPFFSSLFRKSTFEDADSLHVERPLYLTLSNMQLFGKPASLLFFAKAVKKAFKRLTSKFKPDATYGHFLSPSGVLAVDLAESIGAKSFIALGEDNLYDYDKTMLAHYLQKATGIISVSGKNTDYALKTAGISNNKILQAPNSASTEVFYPRHRVEMRKKLNLPANDFILAFVGFFEERKGVNRVLEAVKDLDPKIKLLLIGEGPQQPKEITDRILFCGKLKHAQLPEYLSAASAFILPTLSEGSCNAIVEAMACGLPVISSAIPEIQDQVSAQNGLLVDPTSIPKLREAILELYHNNGLQKSMAEASELAVKNYSIRHRVHNIISFIQQQ